MKSFSHVYEYVTKVIATAALSASNKVTMTLVCADHVLPRVLGPIKPQEVGCADAVAEAVADTSRNQESAIWARQVLRAHGAWWRLRLACSLLNCASR